MLQPLKRIASSTRLKRRQLVMVVALVTTPAVAENADPGAIRMMPPLPLAEIERAVMPHTNHLGNPVQHATTSPVLLTGGPQPPTQVQLKPVSNPVGLREVEASPSDVETRSGMKIERLQPRGVRLNPLAYGDGVAADETPAAQRDFQPTPRGVTAMTPPVKQNNFATAATTPEPKEAGRTSVDEEPVFYSFSDLSDNASPPAEEPAPESPELPQSEPRQSEPRQLEAETPKRSVEKSSAKPADSRPPATVSRFQPTRRKPIAVPPLGVQEVEPPTFDRQAGSRSLGAPTRSSKSSAASRLVERRIAPSAGAKGDRPDDDASNVFAPTVVEPAPRSTISSAGGSVLQAAEPIDFSDDAADSPESQQLDREQSGDRKTRSASSNETAARPIVMSPAQRSASGVSLVEPFELNEPEEASKSNGARDVDTSPTTPIQTHSKPRISEKADQTNASSTKHLDEQNTARTLQRYRPAVEVKQVPIIVGRHESHAGSRPTVQPVQALSIDSQRKIEVPDGQQLVPLRMTKAEARSLKVGGEIVDVQLGDAGICQVLKASSNELKLVGTDHGVTRLLVRARADENAELQTRVFEIRIGAAVGDTIHQTQQHARLLNHSISEAFPECRVIVTAHPDKLTVNGVCGSEASAKQIMRMVRKTCLVPVEDLLTIR